MEANQTNIAALKNPAPREQNMPLVTMGFGNLQSFELMQRAAKMLAYSTLVPVAYRAQKEVKDYGKVVGYEDNPNALPNCVVALNMAQRMGADPLMVMQNLYIVEGRPSWSSQFIIAAINNCGRYTPLRFQLSEPAKPQPIEYTETKWVRGPGGKNEKQEAKKTITVANRTCIAWAIEKETGERLESPVISIDMAVAEGWLTKNGSKWQTMPEVMLRYRAAAFFGKLYAPELLMGLQTAEEAHDIIEMEPVNSGRPVDINGLRGENLPTPEQGSGKAPASDITDVEENTPESATDGASEAGTPAGPASETSSPAASGAAVDNGDALTFAQVADAIAKAKDLDVLDVAADLIGLVPDAEQQKELTAMYQKRREELSKPAPRARSGRPNLNLE